MNTHKSSITVGIVVVAALVTLALFTQLTQAQGPGPGVQPQNFEPTGPNAAVGQYMPIQGRLTDAGGTPLNGVHTITFRLYDDPTVGAVVCSDTNSVTVTNGLFSSEIGGNCTDDKINGQPLYLGVTVGSDAEMTPRQPIYPVPYARSLRPGAIISDTQNDAILHIENWGVSGRGLRAYAMSSTGTNYGMVGASKSPDGYGGYFYNTGSGTGLYGRGSPGVLGESSGFGYGVVGRAGALGAGVKGEGNILAFGGLFTSTVQPALRAESDGVALQLGGSGRIESTADTTIAVSPLKMIPQWESVGDLEFLSDGAYMEVRPSTSGFQYVHIPVDLPSTLFGTTTKLKSVRICYRCDQAGSFVSTTIVSQGTDSGTISQLINDTTARTSTSWECYTVTDSTPNAIQGSLYIQLTLSFAGTGSAHDIRIGNIALGLTEQ